MLRCCCLLPHTALVHCSIELHKQDFVCAVGNKVGIGSLQKVRCTALLLAVGCCRKRDMAA